MERGRQLPDFVAKAKEIAFLDKLIRYHPIYYARALRAIRKFDSSDLLGRRALAHRLRDHSLRRASRTRYGKQYGRDIECWPMLEKETLRDNPSLCSSHVLLSISASTGGTTGLPLKLARSVECAAAEQAFIDNLILGYGLDFRTARIAVLRADEVKDPADNKPPYGVLRHNGKRLIMSNAHMSNYTIDWFVSALTDFRPQVLWVYPGMLANMIRLMDESGATLRVPLVLASSESMEPGLFETIEQTLSAKVIDYYGQGERVCFASSTRPGEYWFAPAYGYVELQPQETNETENGTKTAKILSTAYWNKAMPLVRYNTGDLAIIPSDYTAHDLEEVALGLKPFIGIAGRSEEFIVTQDGKSIRGLNHLPRSVEHILRLQVVQRAPDKVTIKTVTRPGFNENDRNKILANARALIPPEIDVTVEVADILETAPNGKTPFVIRQV